MAVYSKFSESICLQAGHTSQHVCCGFKNYLFGKNIVEMVQVDGMIANGQPVIVDLNYPGRQTNPSLKDIHEFLDL